MDEGEKSCSFNVGGRVFSIPVNRLANFQHSLLLKSARAQEDQSTLFIDRDASAFTHIYYYINTGKLTSACALEMNILRELAAGLHLTALQQALEKLHVTKCLEMHPVKPEPERVVHKVMPPGLVSAPLIAGNEEVLYCFVLLEHARLHPGLITCDSLLWLCEDVAIIECSSLFRFIANYLQSGTVLLPELFSAYGELFDEARMVGMTDFIATLQELSAWKDGSSDSCSEGQMCCAVQPLYTLSLSLLVKYPDSSLGQLYVQSNLEGSRLYITGNGVLFQHVENWLGTSRLPLTRTTEELPCLCAYLDSQDELYLAIREAMQELFHRKDTTGYMSAVSESASVSTFTLYKVVKVYAGTHWYATYFKTLIKHPELLSNSSKSKWIVYGESLLVKGDGQMFRHILNFLRCGHLLLPGDFREWPLLCQEIEAFQIPALSRALWNSSDYRAWCKARAHPRNLFTSYKDTDIFNSNLGSEESQESPENTLLSREPERRQKEERSVLEHVALLMETAVLSKSHLMRMSSELSGTEKSGLTVPLATAFCSNWQSCNEQLHSSGSAQRQAHTEERPEPNTHMHRNDVVPSRGQRASRRRSVSPITSFTLPVVGWVLMVDHPAVLGRGEAGGYFTRSVIYTDEHPQMMQPARKEGNDVAFAYFSMSYEEMVYARECLAFFTGTILDSSRLDLKDCIVKLVHRLWTGHMEVDNFVQELLTAIRVKPHKQLEKHEKLVQWVKFTLPLAKRYTACVREFLRKTSFHTVSLFPPDLLEVTIPTHTRVKQ